MPKKTPAKHVPVEKTKADPRTERLIERLLDAATRLFVEKGYDATSMGEISALARASKETFYRHFPNKEDLFRAVVVRRAGTSARAVMDILVPEDPPEKALMEFGERVLSNMMTQDSINFHRLLGMSRERFPNLLEIYRNAGPTLIRDAVARYLRHQVEMGRMRSLDPLVGARQFFDLVAAEMMIKANLSGKANPSKAKVRQRVKEAVECFLHGYAA